MKTGFLITARMKSTRLPKKLTLKINNREIVAWMIDRLKQNENLDSIVIATSTNPQDDILCEIAKREKIKFYRGSEDDVIKRLYNAAKHFEIDYFLQIPGDCPLVSFDFFDQVIDAYNKTNADLITTYDLPHGFYMYGMKISALKKVIEMKNTSDTEVWTAYFLESGLFNVVEMQIPEQFHRQNYRLTLDYTEDYEFMNTLFQQMGPDTYKKSTLEIIDFLDKHPEIVNINKDCEEMYKKNIQCQTKMILK